MKVAILSLTVLQLNPTINAECSNIVGGAAICVDSAVNTCGATYVVGGQEGGCSGIASSLGITLQTLLQLNPNVNSECTNIYIGVRPFLSFLSELL